MAADALKQVLVGRGVGLAVVEESGVGPQRERLFAEAVVGLAREPAGTRVVETPPFGPSGTRLPSGRPTRSNLL